MTRFARAKGSKASNERIPEEATPWNEMKKQLLEKNQQGENFKKKQEADKQREKNYKAFLQEVDEEKTKNSQWAEFPNKNSSKKVVTSNTESETNEIHKKKKGVVKRKLQKSEVITDKKQQKVEDLCTSNETSNNGTAAKKKKGGVKRKLEESEMITDKKQQTIDDLSTASETISNGTGSKKKKVKIGKQQKGKNRLEKSNSVGENQENSEAVTDSSNPKLEKKKPNTVKVVPQKRGFKQKQNGQKMDKNPKKPVQNVPPSEEDLKKIQKKKERKLRQIERRKLKKQENGTNPPQTTPKPKKIKNTMKPERRKVFQNRMNINGKEVDIAYVDGFPIKKEDAERIKQLRRQMISKGLPRSEIKIALKLERRKAEKCFAREKKKVCFNCRKSGHNLSECPELGKQIAESAGTGICFKCGSTEHTHFECKVVRGQEFKFAQCFICHEQGHIARQCPDNARGLYPKGGACKVCGDVTHLKKDCPKFQAQQQQLEQSVMLDTMNTLDNPDSLGPNEEPVKFTAPKRPNKIVKF